MAKKVCKMKQQWYTRTTAKPHALRRPSLYRKPFFLFFNVHGLRERLPVTLPRRARAAVRAQRAVAIMRASGVGKGACMLTIGISSTEV